MAWAFQASRGSSIVVAALVVALSFGCASTTTAFGRRSHIASGYGRGAPPPMVARYAIDEGGDFLLDREGRYAFLRFSDSPEIWVLSPFHGPRGDIIYKNDVNEPVLRATKLGGMTVFTPRRPEGAAAALIGAGTPVRLTTLWPTVLYQRLLQASVRSTRAAEHNIEFDAPEADPGSDGLIADTALVVVEAMIDLTERPRGHAILARLGSIAIQTGKHPSVAVRGRVVTITVDPTLGFAGRPSSERILLALGGR